MNAVQKKSWKKPKRRPQAMDYSILFLVLFLVGFGLVILYSTSSYKASLLYNDTTYWVKKQALFAAMGICGMLFIATRDYHIWQKKWWFAWVIYGGVIGLLLLRLEQRAMVLRDGFRLGHLVYSLLSLPKLESSFFWQLISAVNQEKCDNGRRWLFHFFLQYRLS